MCSKIVFFRLLTETLLIYFDSKVLYGDKCVPTASKACSSPGPQAADKAGRREGKSPVGQPARHLGAAGIKHLSDRLVISLGDYIGFRHITIRSV